MNLSSKTLRLTAPGVLELQQLTVPSPGRGEVVVRVHAAAITRDELEWPTDRLPATPSYELSGVVEAVGPGVDEVAAGDEVYALTPFDRDGVAAEYAVVPARVLAPRPPSLGHVESAALPMGGLSAWQGLFEHGRLRPGERLVITGAAGGVGHLAVQLARWRGAKLVDDDAELAFDTTGGEVAAQEVVSIAVERPGATYFVVEPNRDQLVELAQLVEQGVVRPQIDDVFPLDEARAAFERVAARGKRGKVVLRVRDD
jgi:NADPH:quinone reductase-like Zn-dependent oxidoreductase